MLEGTFRLQKKAHTCGRLHSLLSAYKPNSREPDRLRVLSEHGFEVIIPKSANKHKTMHNILTKYTSYASAGRVPIGVHDV